MTTRANSAANKSNFTLMREKSYWSKKEPVCSKNRFAPFNILTENIPVVNVTFRKEIKIVNESLQKIQYNKSSGRQ